LQYFFGAPFGMFRRYELDFCRKSRAFASLNTLRHFSRFLRHRPTKAANFILYRREISGAKIMSYRKTPYKCTLP